MWFRDWLAIWASFMLLAVGTAWIVDSFYAFIGYAIGITILLLLAWGSR